MVIEPSKIQSSCYQSTCDQGYRGHGIEGPSPGFLLFPNEKIKQVRPSATGGGDAMPLSQLSATVKAISG